MWIMAAKARVFSGVNITMNRKKTLRVAIMAIGTKTSGVFLQNRLQIGTVWIMARCATSQGRLVGDPFPPISANILVTGQTEYGLFFQKIIPVSRVVRMMTGLTVRFFQRFMNNPVDSQIFLYLLVTLQAKIP